MYVARTSEVPTLFLLRNLTWQILKAKLCCEHRVRIKFYEVLKFSIFSLVLQSLIPT